MDRPRKPHLRPRQLVAATLVVAVLAAVFGYASFKATMVAALQMGARVGFAMTQGAPGIEPESLRRRTDEPTLTAEVQVRDQDRQ